MRPATAAVAALLGMALLLGGGAWLVGRGDAGAMPAIDAAGLAAMNHMRGIGFDIAFLGISWLGSLYVLAPAAALAAWRGSACTWPERGFIALALIGASVIAQLAKLIVARPRPELFPSLVPLPADASYPSAHAMQLTALAAAWLLRRGASVTAPRIALAVLAVVLVALSRVYLQVHHPTDVAVGAVAALLWVLALRAGIDAWATRRRL